MVKKRLKIYVSPFTIVMCAVIVAFGGAGQLCIYVFTITAHEVAHAFTAQKLGYVLDSVKFMPYGAALSGKFETMSAKDEIIVAAAGPIANVAIAVLTTALWWMFPSVYAVTGDLATANIFTACFNVLPVFPLDGGRIALAAASTKLKREKAYKRLRKVGYVISFLFLSAFVALLIMKKVNLTLASAGAFMLVSTVFPDNDSAYRSLYKMAYLKERLKKGIKVNRIMIDQSATLMTLRKLLNPEYFTVFVVVDDDMRQREITESELERIALKYPLTLSLSEVFMDKNFVNVCKFARQ